MAKRTTDDPRFAAARELAAFLRAPDTQSFIATFKKGTYDDAPLFFPVVVNEVRLGTGLGIRLSASGSASARARARYHVMHPQVGTRSF